MKMKALFLAIALAGVLYVQFCVDLKALFQVTQEGVTPEVIETKRF